MQTSDLVSEASPSSLHLTVSEEERVIDAPELSSLSHSSSTASEESSYKEESFSTAVTHLQPLRERTNSKENRCSDDSNYMGSRASIKSLELNNNSSQAETDCSEIFDGEKLNYPTPNESNVEILSSKEVDGSMYIEMKDDGCGSVDETVAEKVQRLARKAGIVAGGGTMTAVGTVMLFLPCPTPSIYLMIGGMAIMAKEIPAAQRKLDSTKESLERALDRAEENFATRRGRKINIVLDNGSTSKVREFEETGEHEEKSIGRCPQQKVKHIAMTQELMINQQNSAVKRHFIKVGRNVILPLLSKVCTPQEGVEVKLPDDTVKTEPCLESSNDGANVEGKENGVSNPFARFAKYRESRRESLLRLEELREREAMLARINEGNLREAALGKSREAEAQKQAEREIDEFLKM